MNKKKYLIEQKKLMKEWNYKRNVGIDPSSLTVGSNKKVWWLCFKGHEWEASIYSRVHGSGCPFCSGRCATSDQNLLLEYPHIAKEWHPTKNGNLTPNNIKSKSNKKVWWLCSKGHEWEARVDSRINGNGCYICSKEVQTSYPEQAIFFYIKKIYPDAINGYSNKKLGISEIDIYIPSIKFGIEYDGERWHQKRDNDLLKDKICEENSIRLIRIKENKENNTIENESSEIIYNPKKNKENLDLVIKILFKDFLFKQVDDKFINTIRDKTYILEQYVQLEKENSLEKKYPAIAKEWHPTKNGNLKPSQFQQKSNQKVWWICPLKHEYTMTISNKVSGQKCPICANKKILVGFNDLQTKYPAIAKEWNYIKNGELKPNMILYGSHQKVWWICSKGHEWKAGIDSRTRGSNCPICSNKVVLKGFNDLATTDPELTKEWHPTKNGNLKPDQQINTKNKIWWICSDCSFEWQSTIDNRKNGCGCPECKKIKIKEKALKRFLNKNESIVKTNPELIKEWNTNRNINLDPNNFTNGSHQKVWWKCSNCGYEWENEIRYRIQKGRGCPKCRKGK